MCAVLQQLPIVTGVTGACQPSSRHNVAVVSEKAGFSGPWGRVRSSKTSLLDLGPPLRVPVGEEVEDEKTSLQSFTEPQRSPLAKSCPKNAQNGRGEDGSASMIKRNTSVPDLHSGISHRQRKTHPLSVVPQSNPLLVSDVTSSQLPATHHLPPLPPSISHLSHHAPTLHHSHSQTSSVELPSSQPHIPAPQPPQLTLFPHLTLLLLYTHQQSQTKVTLPLLLPPLPHSFDRPRRKK